MMTHSGGAWYLRQAARTRLLKPEEERHLFEQIEEARRSLETVDGRRTPPRLQHLRDLEKGLVEANLRLVVSVAKRYRHSHLPMLDLVQEGTLGLMKAIDRFDYRRGFRFSPFAIWCIL